MSNEAEVSAIADALDTLLNAIAALSRPSTTLKAVTVADIAASTAHEELAEEIISDPVGRSLRLGIEALGERLNEIGGIAAMHAALADVTGRDPDHEGRRADILDKRWDGIGSWLA